MTFLLLLLLLNQLRRRQSLLNRLRFPLTLAVRLDLGETVDAEEGDGTVVLRSEVREEVEAEVAAEAAVLNRAENLKGAERSERSQLGREKEDALESLERYELDTSQGRASLAAYPGSRRCNSP